ncbi:unnamed protein product [Phytomonas sp. Hart1]|nr:unnamed protein product [Phytomonas sp. Hart1]|eukprot:CCW66225.1 unnamed protein product [Phytomonas sp. isolate Hart1]
MEIKESTANSNQSDGVSASLETERQTLDPVNLRQGFLTNQRNHHETRAADTNLSNAIQSLGAGASMSYPSKRNAPTLHDDADKMSQRETRRQKKNDALSLFKMECLAATAFLLGSPLQRDQPHTGEAVQFSMRLASELLAREIDPERVIALIESHTSQIDPLP